MNLSTSDPVTFPWASRPTAVSARRIGLADGLNREWCRLRSDPAALAQIDGWGLSLGRVEHLDDLLCAAGYARPVDDDEGDVVLACLVRLAAGDTLAARVVLHRILPGLIHAAVRRGPVVEGGAVAAFDDLVAAAWLTIRTFPIDRRPRRVAANLLRDVEYQAFVRVQRRTTREVHSGDLEGQFGELPDPAADGGPGPRFEWEELVAWARRRGIDGAQLDLLVRMAQGQSSTEIAAALRCTDRTVRNRRHAAVAAVRRAYADAAA